MLAVRECAQSASHIERIRTTPRPSQVFEFCTPQARLILRTHVPRRASSLASRPARANAISRDRDQALGGAPPARRLDDQPQLHAVAVSRGGTSTRAVLRTARLQAHRSIAWTSGALPPLSSQTSATQASWCTSDCYRDQVSRASDDRDVLLRVPDPRHAPAFLWRRCRRRAGAARRAEGPAHHIHGNKGKEVISRAMDAWRTGDTCPWTSGSAPTLAIPTKKSVGRSGMSVSRSITSRPWRTLWQTLDRSLSEDDDGAEYGRLSESRRNHCGRLGAQANRRVHGGRSPPYVTRRSLGPAIGQNVRSR